MTPETLSLILTIVFWCTISLIVLFAIVGAVKGFWKTVTGMVVQAFLLLLVALISPGIATFLGNIDLSGMFPDGTVTVWGIVVPAGSLRSMVTDLITQSGYVSPVTGQDLYEVAMALTNILLSTAVFFVLAIFAALFGWLLGGLVYHTLVKWFVPKRIRMTFKFRLLGAGAGLAMGFFASWLLLTPFSYLSNALRQNKSTLENAKAYYGEEVDAYLDYAIAIGDSPAGADWLAGMSAPLMNLGTSTRVLDASADLSTLTSLLKGLGKGFSVGMKPGSNTPFDYLAVVGDQAAVSLILDTLMSNNLVLQAMPALLEASMIYVEAPEGIDLSKLDFRNVDYSGEFSAVKGIYQALFDSGFLTQVIDRNDFTLNLSQRDDYLKALSIFASDPLVQKNLSVLMGETANYIRSVTGYEILNTDPAAYASGGSEVDWAEEITVLGNAVFTLSESLDIPLSRDGVSRLQGTVWEAMKDPAKFQSVRSVLVGTSSRRGLFDTFLLKDGVFNASAAVQCLFSYYPVLNDFLDREKAKEVFVGASSEVKKRELTALVDMLPSVRALADLSYRAETNSFVIDLSDSGTIQAMRGVVEEAQSLSLLKDVLPEAFYKSFPRLLSNTFGRTEIFGLNVYSFDFSNPDEVLKGMGSFLEAVPSLIRIYRLVETHDSIKDILPSIDPEDVRILLEKFADSKMLNPDRSTPEGTRKNGNLNALSRALIDRFRLSEYGIEMTDDPASVAWTAADGSHPEIDRLVGLLEEIKATSDGLEEDGRMRLDDLEGDRFSSLLTRLASSDLLGDSTNSFLNRQLKPVLDGISLEVEFKKKREDWLVEGEKGRTPADSLGLLLDLTRPLWQGGKSVDYTRVSSDYLNALLTLLESSKILEDSGSSLPTFLGGVFTRSFSGENGSFSARELLGYHPALAFQDPGEKGWIASQSVQDGILFDKAGEGPTFDGYEVDRGGEIDRLTASFSSLSSYDAKVMSGDLTSQELSSLLLSLRSSHTLSAFLPPVLRRAFANAGSSASSRGVDFSLLDVDSYAELDDSTVGEDGRTAFQRETDDLIFVYSAAKEGTIFNLLSNLDDSTYMQGQKAFLEGLLQRIDEMALTTGKGAGERHTFRADFYAVLLALSHVPTTPQERVDQAIFNESDPARAEELMRLRVGRIEAREDAVAIFQRDRATLLDFLTQRDAYALDKGVLALSRLEETELLKGLGNHLLAGA